MSAALRRTTPRWLRLARRRPMRAALSSSSSLSPAQNTMPRLTALREQLRALPPDVPLLPPRPQDAKEDTGKTPYLPPPSRADAASTRVLIETYGCQMNESDTEVVWGVLASAGYQRAAAEADADVVLLNTCAIRDGAEAKVWARLRALRAATIKHRRRRVVGLLGCMAERLKARLLQAERGSLCQLVCGPDAYRSLPGLLQRVQDGGQDAINVLLSHDETYADVAPVRVAENKVSAYVSIMRGCDNMCAYCIVPFTRGRERSRPVDSILDEVRQLSAAGYKEVVLLGQNVNSYQYQPSAERNRAATAPHHTPGFRPLHAPRTGGVRFAELVARVAAVDRNMRVRFTSPHPKHFPAALLRLVREQPNVCSALHIPAQSGSSAVLEAMRRGHDRASYDQLIATVREEVPSCAISSDFISGFCGETEDDHRQSLDLLRQVQYDQAYLFAYSMREGTMAHRRLQDDVPAAVKQRRLAEMIDLHYSLLKKKNEKEVGRTHLVLVDRTSRRSSTELSGRTDTNKPVVFEDKHLPPSLRCAGNGRMEEVGAGDYVAVRITKGGVTLRGEPLAKSSISEFAAYSL